MIPLAEPNIAGNEGRYLQECVATNFVSSVGPFVDRFEGLVAMAAGRAGAVATNNGTAALHAALIALGVRPGDLVVMPALTFIATANAASYCHARPAFLDVSPESWTLDPAALRRFLADDCAPNGGDLIHRASRARVGAVVAVHTLGHPIDGPALESVCTDYDVPLLADAAAALGATCRGRPATAFGRLAAISFNGNKTVTCGGGGAVVGDDLDLLKRIRHLTTTARLGADYTHDRVGYNYRMTNLEAAVGCAQMERLDEFVARKRAIALRYDRALTGIDGVAPFPRASWGESACWFSGLLAAPAGPHSAARILETLTDAGVGARPFWKPMHLQTPYADCPRGSLTLTEGLWRRIVALPCSTGLTEAQQDVVIATLHRALGRSAA